MAWFSARGARDNFEKYLLPMAAKGEPFHYLELGCWCGDSIVWVAENLLKYNSESTATGVDPWAEMDRHPQTEMDGVAARAMARVKNYDRVTLIREYSSVWLRQQTSVRKYNAIYVDGDHSAAFVLDDAILSFPLLAIGGLHIFDDYRNVRKRADHVEHAALAFHSVYNRFTTVAWDNYQFALTKIEDPQSGAFVNGSLRPAGVPLESRFSEVREKIKQDLMAR